MELFDNNKYPDIKRCIGRKHSARVDKILNHDDWRAMANNKIINYALLSHFNFSIPKTMATYNAGSCRIADEVVINDPDALHRYFSEEAQYPIFIKPVHGCYGHGTFSLASFDAGQHVFTSNVGDKIKLSKILSAGANHNFKGLLIQSYLKPHKKVLRTVGKNTSCVRVILIRDGDEVVIHCAFWKIAREHNITDNFSYGKHGNFLAGVDVETGRVTRVINGLWPHENTQQEHPDTHEKLIDFQLPDWQLALDQCVSASHIFSGLSLQSWDISFCEDGPVLMELNTEPNLEMAQFISEKAFIDDQLGNILKDFDLK
ncbi:MAG: hypothetical protein GY777_31855 [Candidatus Brocadiaceae bacterium]|nr:hypothetical protein [Candidatus Brocadiaceae bacterium]